MMVVICLALGCLTLGMTQAQLASRSLLQAMATSGVANEGAGVYTATTPVAITLANTTYPATTRTMTAIPAIAAATTPAGVWAFSSLNTGVIVIHASVTSNNYALFMERPGNRENAPNVAAIYNLNDNTFQYLPFPDNPFCSAHITTITDQVLVVGGDNVGLQNGFVDGRYNVRLITTGPNPSYSVVARMQPYFSAAIDPNSGARWYPSLATMPDGTILIVGGQTQEGGNYNDGTSGAQTFQFFNPTGSVLTPNQYLPFLRTSGPVNLYPFITVLSTGQIMIVGHASTAIYTQTTYALANTTVVVPDLPRPVSYPYTASLVLLPLVAPGYTNRVLAVGGTTDFANPGTAAASTSYLLDFSLTPLHWITEDSGVPRVMPDAILLPDGTVVVANGGSVGVAGGGPGTANAAVLGPAYGSRHAQLYNPGAAVGSRWSAALADSLQDRLYHSNAMLTVNGELLITGSESTENYNIQIWTPPYLTGNPNRPIINTISRTSPAYGQTFVVTFGYTQAGSAPAITRVVLNRIGGSTHSTHFDQRQVVLAYTVAAGRITVTAPPRRSVAPPGIYMLFILAAGVPGQAVYIGLGGAAPAVSTVITTPTPIAVTPVLANGMYTITNAGRPTCANAFTATTCPAMVDGTNNLVSLSATALTDPSTQWQLTSLPSGAFSISSVSRSNVNCGNYLLSCAPCYNNFVDLYNYDDASGRQEWILQRATGGANNYYITSFNGRDCGQNYVTAASDCTVPGNLAVDFTGPVVTPDNLQAWTILPAMAAPVMSRPLADGTYTIQSPTRTACESYLAGAACPSPAQVLNTTVDGSGLQRWTFTYLAGSDGLYDIALNCGKAACGYQFLSVAADCGAHFVDMWFNDDMSGRQQWQLRAITVGTQTQYTMAIVNGRGVCTFNFASVQGCGGNTFIDLYDHDDGSGNQHWIIAPIVNVC